MTTQTNELRSLMTPILVLLFAIVLVVIAAAMLRHPESARADLVMVSSRSSVSDHPTAASSVIPTPSSPTTTALAAAEDQLVKNMSYFDSRFERYTAELHLEEEKALSRSDLVTTRYQLKSLQEDLASLQTLSREWETLHQDLQINVAGSQIAGSKPLLDDYLKLTAGSLLSERDVAELTDRLRPLSDFVAMLEDQDKVAYEPSERFQSRLTTMVHNVEKATTDFSEGLMELKRLQREAQTLAPLEETLQEAAYRRRREQAAATIKTLPIESTRSRSDTVKPPPAPIVPVQPSGTEPNRTSEPSRMATPQTVNKSPPVSVQTRPSVTATRLPSKSSGGIQPNSNGDFLPANWRNPAATNVRTSSTSTSVQKFVCPKCGRTWTVETQWNPSWRMPSNCRCR
ncbi:MAG: hypothetical protein KDA96_20135 [Planctomycetaceae bacterium]|nr:hypothetical protein [Planctomycetaceae bacterium]